MVKRNDDYKPISKIVGVRVTVFVVMMFIVFGVGIIFYTPIERSINGVIPIMGKTKVHFVDVGHGDAIIVETKDKVVMIDSGLKGDGLRNYISHAFANGLKIDYFILTHTDTDHIGGAYNILKYNKVQTLYVPQKSGFDFEFDRILSLAKAQKIEIRYNFVGEKIQGEDYCFEFLSPKRLSYAEENNYSPIIRFVAGGKSVLFTGDAEAYAEEEVLFDDVNADVLKVGHHGSTTSSSLAFLQAVSPKYAVISCKEGVYNNVPSVEVIERLHAVGVAEENILRTDKLNSIILVLDEDIKIYSSDYANRVFIKYYFILMTLAILMYFVIFKAGFSYKNAKFDNK